MKIILALYALPILIFVYGLTDYLSENFAGDGIFDQNQCRWAAWSWMAITLALIVVFGIEILW